jgi:hypothetical protein
MGSAVHQADQEGSRNDCEVTVSHSSRSITRPRHHVRDADGTEEILSTRFIGDVAKHVDNLALRYLLSWFITERDLMTKLSAELESHP